MPKTPNEKYMKKYRRKAKPLSIYSTKKHSTPYYTCIYKIIILTLLTRGKQTSYVTCKTQNIYRLCEKINIICQKQYTLKTFRGNSTSTSDRCRDG